MTRKDKIVRECLIGFHQVLYNLYHTTLDSEEGISNERCMIYLELLLNYHRDTMLEIGIEKTNTGKIYKKYIDGWNKLAKEQEKEVEDFITDIKNKKQYSYVI